MHAKPGLRAGFSACKIIVPGSVITAVIRLNLASEISEMDMFDSNAKPTQGILAKLNRYAETDALTPSQCAWRFVDSLESNYRFRDQTELLELKLLIESLDREIVTALKEICLTPDDRVYVRGVCADPPGPYVVNVNVDQNASPVRIIHTYSDGESSEILPTDPQRIVVEAIRAFFGNSKNVG